MKKSQKTALIIGAGPAGLTAALEILRKSNLQVIIIEKDSVVGGISKTIPFKGNRIDIGGHRFFSKSDEVMLWWNEILPILDKNNDHFLPKESFHFISQKEYKKNLPKNIMFIRKRISRIFYANTFFTYPITFTLETLKNLGFFSSLTIAFSYIFHKLFPRKPENTLEDFFINKFGKKLYSLFFKEYTEKVWGTSCKNIQATWGAQRIKGLSLRKVISHSLHTCFSKKTLSSKKIETSLIERFLYPKYGPGQMWELVAKHILKRKGKILFHHEIENIYISKNTVTSLEIKNKETQEKFTINTDFVFSSMPISELIHTMKDQPPQEVQAISKELTYRDFITVGILCSSFLPSTKIKDNWIYIQEPGLQVGRIQIYNNWSPFMVKNPKETIWIGLEYFTNKHDAFWSMNDEEILSLAKKELVQMKMTSLENILDGIVIRVEKAYPSYIGSGYKQFSIIKEYLLSLENLYPIGRNGTHTYNNQDHSMLSAIRSVEHMLTNSPSKESLWRINSEKEYHEKR
ncbi:MAG: NAD(P)/FAD-dependent oxidoreductase [Candidatus Moraniibacteriota bacterium]|nr:MAG: NAD(P)/FAD-dependent oxidoreductase [Candidatus Moranbacteria bacterium]QQS61743.1 MAG: NAD(P)/FAD-dependent oxidoreductase [Candidatus Moranbacteria bacterium]